MYYRKEHTIDFFCQLWRRYIVFWNNILVREGNISSLYRGFLWRCKNRLFLLPFPLQALPCESRCSQALHESSFEIHLYNQPNKTWKGCILGRNIDLRYFLQFLSAFVNDLDNSDKHNCLMHILNFHNEVTSASEPWHACRKINFCEWFGQ